jgi:hypothetical protein
LCRTADLAQALRDDVAARGASYEARGLVYSNPSLAALAEAQKALSAGLRAFGATPADRGRLGVGEPKPASKLELLQMRRAGPPESVSKGFLEGPLPLSPQGSPAYRDQ